MACSTPDPSSFVATLYRLLLHRNASETEVRHWADQLAATGDPATLLTGVLAAAEYRAPAGAGGALPQNVEVIVPVCNAERWIAIILDGYRALGLDPLFILDTHSTDRTLALLVGENARVMIARGTHARVESLLFNAIPKLRSSWILRFDDDEMPSRALIDWVCANVNTLDVPFIGFARRWVWQQAPDGQFVTSHCAAASAAAGGDATDDRQFRLFLRRGVTLTEDLHSPGFAADSAPVAPPEAAIYHFDWLVRDRAAREAKIIRYEEQSPGYGWRYAAYYLPEDQEPGFYDFQPLADTAVLALAQSLVETQAGTKRESVLF